MTGSKPEMIIIPDNIPEELRSLKRWITWKYIWSIEDNKWVKIPLVKWSDPKNWKTFEEVYDQHLKNTDIGIGFVFNNIDNIVGIDIDDCFIDRNLSESIYKIINLLGSYTEVTPSQRGLHIIGRVKNKNMYETHAYIRYSGCDHIEFYPDGRWFAFTGLKNKELSANIEYLDEEELKLLLKSTISGDKKEAFYIPMDIPEGGRNTTLFKMACSLRSKGFGKKEIIATLNETNRLRCKPPLPDSEINIIVDQAGNYKPSSPIEIKKDPVIIDNTDDNDDKGDVIFNFNKIPADNLIAKYIKYCCEIQDAYPEYHFSNIMTLLSDIVPAYQHPSFNRVFNNTWIVALGIAGFSGKSTTTDVIKNEIIPILNKIRPFKKLSSKPTPEAFIQNLSGEGNNKQYWLIDEAVGFMKFMSKDYASDLEELILQVYSHSDISRSTKKDGIVEVNDPHIAMLWYTTIENFINRAKAINFESGLFQRPMFFLPRRIKDIKEDKPITQEQLKMIHDIQNHVCKLYELNLNYVKFEENILLNKWKHEQRLKNMKSITSDVKSGARTRSYEHARKLAMLLTIGSQEFLDGLQTSKYSKKDEQQTTMINYIPDWAAELAIEYTENFIKNFDKIYKLCLSNNGSHISKIIRILSENEYASRTQLTSAINTYGKRFDEIILDLVNDGFVEIVERQNIKKGRPEVIYRLYKSNAT